MSRKIVTQSVDFQKKDFINSRNGLALQDVETGTRIVLTAAAILRDDTDGEEKDVAVLCTESDVYTSISSSVVDIIDDIIAMQVEDGGELPTVTLNKRKSKSGRDFLTLMID